MPSKKEKVEKSPEKSSKKKVYADKALTVPKRMAPADEKRKIKTITRYSEEITSDRSTPEVNLKKGKGKKLEDCPQVLSQINKRNRDDDLLRMIHGFLLGRVNKKVPVKNNLKAFSGVHYEDDKGREHLEAKLLRHKVRDLREVAKFFGVDHEGEREDLVKHIADFVEKPRALEVSHSSPKKSSSKRSRSRSSSVERKSSSEKKSSSKKSSSKKSSTKKKSSEKKKRAKKDPNSPKRPLSAFMIFSNEKRDEVREKLGKDTKITEVASKLGKMWKKVDDDEKKKYQKKAAKLKETYEKELKKYNSKKQKESGSDKE